MNRATGVLALVLPVVGAVGAVVACSKFGATDGDTPDAGDVPDAASADTGAAPLEHRIYVFGGVTAVPGAVPIKSAYFSNVAANGDLGPWTRAPALDDDRFAAAWVQNGDVLLGASGVVGGVSLSPEATVGTIPSNPADPSTSWKRSANIATGRHYASALVRGTSIYVSGGRDNKATLPNLERYENGAWSPAGVLSPGVAGHATFLRGSRMYIVGGDRLGTAGPTSSVTMGTFAETSGALVGFEPAGDLKAPTAHHAIALVEPWLFSIGGDVSGAPVATVTRCTFDSAGAVSCEYLTPLPVKGEGVADACAVVSDHTIYLMGGRDSATAASKPDVYIGRVGSTGIISWANGPTLPEGRSAFGCAVSPSSAP